MNLRQWESLHCCLTSGSRRALFVLTLAAYCFVSHRIALAQQSDQSSTSQTQSSGVAAQVFGSSTDNTDQNSVSSLSNLNGNSASASLPAGQIIQILQDNPDLLTEVKDQIAQRLQEQGTPVQPDDLSDQMVYNEISFDANARASISQFLQERGYTSPTAVQDSTAAQMLPQLNEQSVIANNRPNPVGLAAAASTAALNDGSSAKVGSAANREQLQNDAVRRHEEVHASTDRPSVIRQPAPYDLQSMRDLYVQIPDETPPLKRFGSEVFVHRQAFSMTGQLIDRGAALDVPLGPDYVIGPGDSLAISLWGGLTQSIVRTVDREGRILLPEAGVIQVAGLPLEEAERSIRAALTQQFRDAKVSVTISRLHSVRVYVTGDVQRPGAYDISSLATPLSALYAAGGPTSVGSLRIVRHYRGQKLVEETDLYDFLIHGMQNNSARFESGDTLEVPPAGPQVAISGAVRRPAIYELRSGESTLASVIADAGGLTAAASLGHITVERIDANRQRVTVAVHTAGSDPKADQAALATFTVRDGDRIRVAPILPYSQQAIYIQGHVVRPGRLPYVEGMHLSDVLHSYRDLLPEPATRGEIIRLVPPDLHAETIAFNLPDVLIGNTNLDLQPFDTIRIFGRYQADAPNVTIDGEVLRPGTYPLSQGMTVAQLVTMAGGFKRDALLDQADLTSYNVENGTRVESQIETVRIGAAVQGTAPDADATLKPGDILTIHQITGWSDIGESVTIQGQVRFPGSYGFREGERLSSLLRRAGGLRATAYTEGAVLIREQVRELEEKSQQELIRQIETNSAAARLGPAVGGGNAGGTLELIKAQQDEALAQLKSHPATGRMVIHISADINSWANTPVDIELRRGDEITIPKRPGFVLVTGQVYNATALTFTPGKTAAWYLGHAGGTNSTANRKEIFIIRANGSVIGRHSGGWFDANVLATQLNPGDVVVVPQKIIGSSLLWRNLLTTAQLASSIAITAGIAVAAL